MSERYKSAGYFATIGMILSGLRQSCRLRKPKRSSAVLGEDKNHRARYRAIGYLAILKEGHFDYQKEFRLSGTPGFHFIC